MRTTHLLVAALLTLSISSISTSASADAWFDAGDSTLRHNIQYLVDSGVINVPLTAWPIPSADIAQALDAIKDRSALKPGQLSALRGVERQLGIFTHDSTRYSVHASGAADPQRLRTFENTPREEGEVGGSFSMAGTWYSGRLTVAAVTSPADDETWRLDGSYGSVRWGNWLFTAGALDRWWGPGWDGSLILSNNARPVPALALDRESSEAFKTPWLHWIGPWRLTTFMGKMEPDRQDLDHPLLFGMRITAKPLSDWKIGSVMPLRGLEFSLERTAQWCAETLPCNWNAFWNLFTGKDNQGENVGSADEPGNQLAGWSLRIASPFDSVPVAFYRQKTGEVTDLNSPLPRRTLDIYGLEAWASTKRGLTWRAHVEYANTACAPAAGTTEPEWDCAYNNHLFDVEGYRDRGRPLGDSIDGDGRSYTLGLQFVTPDTWSASLLLRYAELNRGGVVPDTRNTVAQEPTDLSNIEFAVNLPLVSGDLKLGLGFDRSTIKSTDQSDDTVRGYAQFNHRF